MSNMTKQELNRLQGRLRIFNLLIAAIALTCVIMLFFGNLWSVSLHMPINNEVMDALADMLDDMGGDGEDDIAGDIFFRLDFGIVTDLNLSIDLDIALSSPALISGVFGDPIEAVLGDIITGVTDQIPGVVNPIITAVVQVAAVVAIEVALEAMREAVPELPEGASAVIPLSMTVPVHELAQINSDAVTDMPEFVAILDAISQEALEELIEGFIGGELTQAGVVEQAGDLLYDALIVLEFTPEEIANIMAEFDEMVEEVMDEVFGMMGVPEGGTFDVMGFIMNTLSDMLGVELEYGGELTAAAMAALISRQMADEGLDGPIAWAIRGFGIVLILHILLWVWQLVWALLGILLIKRRHKVGTLLVRLFGWGFFLVFVIIPAIAFAAASGGLGAGLLGEAYYLVAQADVRFMSMTIVSFIGVCLMWIIGILGHWRTKRRVRDARVVE